MGTIGAFEAKTHLASLLDRVAQGERITITRHGVPAVMLVPIEPAAPKLTHQEIVQAMRELRKRVKPGKIASGKWSVRGADLEPGRHRCFGSPGLVLSRRRQRPYGCHAAAPDVLSLSEHLRNVLPLAREHGLSAYDAAYLELSIRYGAPLATLDRKLREAAHTAGVRIFAQYSG